MLDNTVKYKARLVACRYSQKYSRDYDYTFAPTAKWKSMCILLHIAAIDWDIESFDVENAYIEAPIDHEIYMNLPIDFCLNLIKVYTV
jgi:hypothetical protein